MADDHAPEFLERYNGFRRALAEAGIEFDVTLKVDAQPSEESGRTALARMLDSGRTFDAVFSTSDLTALGAMRELHARGFRTPEDVALVGFDNIAASRLSEPPLTTVAQDTRRAAEVLIETLVAKIEGGERDSVLMPVELVVRASS